MSDQISSQKPRRRVTRRVHHSEEIWAQARRDYLAGFTASAVSKHCGVSVDAIRKRASKQGWRQAHHLSKNAPAPLSPFPDADQASRIGPSVFQSRAA